VEVGDSACFDRGVGDGVWKIVDYDTTPYDKQQSLESITAENKSGNLRNPPPPLLPTELHACPWTPAKPARKVGDRTWREAREFAVYSKAPDNTNVTRYRYEVREYVFLGARLKNDDAPSGATYDRSALPSDFPRPYLLGFRRGDKDPDARRQLRYLAVVYRKQLNAVAPQYFQSPIGDTRVAYGQARVYNPTAYDTFTQDWRVSLEPASLLEEGTLLRLGGANPTSAVGSAAASGPLAVVVRWVGNLTSSIISVVNNH